MLQTILLALGAILLCSAHLGVGFFAGCRLGASLQPGGRRSREDVPSYFPAILDLLERSQQLHLQTGLVAQELPEKLVLAVARLMESAESLKTNLPATSAAPSTRETPTPNSAARSTWSRLSTARKPQPKPSSPGGMTRPADDTCDSPPTFATSHSRHNRQLTARFDEDTTSSSLAMTDMMNMVVKANRAAEGEPTSEARYPYPTQQFVAFYTNELPAAEEFVRVQCLDVSASGISFLLDHVPPSDSLVISLGKTPQLRFMVTKVMNQHFMVANGQEGYRVGCQFLRRLNSNSYAWDEQRGAIVMAAESCHAGTSTDLVAGAEVECGASP